MNRKRLIIFTLSFPLILLSFCNIYGQQNQPNDGEGIVLSDPKLKLELVTSGLDFPTTMAFLGPDDFLILEKSGTVKRVTNGKVLDKPLLQIDVNVKDERGLLGIAVSEKRKTLTVHLFQIKTYLTMFFFTMLYVKRKMRIVRIKFIDMI